MTDKTTNKQQPEYRAFLAVAYTDPADSSTKLGPEYFELTGDAEEMLEAIAGAFGAGVFWHTIPGGDLPSGQITTGAGQVDLSSTDNIEALAEYGEELARAEDIYDIPTSVFAEITGDYCRTIPNPEEIELYPNGNDPRLFALELANSLGSVHELLTPEQIESYIDWHALGRDLLHEYAEIDGYAVRVDQ